MAYYNGKKVLSVVKTDQAQYPTYQGSYLITENATLPTEYKALEADIVVAIPEYQGNYNITENGTLSTQGKVMTDDVVVAIPEYQGNYNITENGTLSTQGKVLNQNIVVDVPPIGVFEKAFARTAGTSWQGLFQANSDRPLPFGKLHAEDLVNFDFSRSNQITNMNYMFDGCAELTEIPLFDTSNAQNMYGFFRGCTSLETCPQFNTGKATNMAYFFSRCSHLQAVPLLNTSKATRVDGMFDNCSALKIIPALNLSASTNNSNFAWSCTNLEEFHAFGMKDSFDISRSTKLTRTALVEILNNLASVQSTKRLTIGSTNLSKLTEEDKAIAINKGWTLA